MKTYLINIITIVAFVLTQQVYAGEGNEGVSKTKAFAVIKGGVLDLSIDGGDVRIVPWEKQEVTVTAHAIEEEDFDDLRMVLHGNTVQVENYSGDGWTDLVQYVINVPSQFDINVKTTCGTIIVEGPLTGKIKGSTSAGDIRLSNLGGFVDMNTSGGDIRTGNIQGDLVLKTSGGDIKIGSVTGEADVNTSGGDIRVENVKKTLLAKTSGGNIYIGDVGGQATVSTSGGNVTVGRVSGSAKLITAGGDIDLEAATGDVKAKTAGGNIRLLSITGAIDARTAGGDVQAELLPSGKGGSKLSSANGEIRLYVPENSKATVHARIRIEGRWKRSRDDYRIHSDFTSQTYEMSDEDREIRATYILNGGGEVITLETMNADITIRKMLQRPK